MLCPECKKNGIRTQIKRGKLFCTRSGHQVPLLIPRTTNIITEKVKTANKRVANWFLYLFFAVGLMSIAGILFYYIGKLPLYISSIATILLGVMGVISLFVTGVQITTGYIVRIWHFANKRSLMIFFSTITALALILFNWFILAGWSSLLSEPTPYCSNSQDWNIPNDMLEGTPKPSCDNISGLIMQQNSPTRAHYAELDLNTAHGQKYSQTSFRVKVDGSFEKSDENTFGCLIVQTTTGKQGGYIFCVNYLGDWKLQDATNLTGSTPSGSISTELYQKVGLMITVQYGQFQASINNQKVISIPDALSSGVVGLIVEKNGQVQSSPVIFSNFEFDKAVLG